MVETKIYKNREEWLKGRQSYIGGSDASCIMGDNPWKSNVSLFYEKIGSKNADNLDNNPLVIYGSKAEEYQRALFELDYPEMKVHYKENNMFFNTDYPWAHASLDGWMEDEKGDLGIFECKTATIQNEAQARKWAGKNFPRYYYWQVLHYMMVTGAKFVILRAQLKKNNTEEVMAEIKHYRILREECEYDMYNLMKEEKEFYRCIQEKREPALKLPI